MTPGERNPRLAELRRRAEQGDRYAAAAVRAYGTDAQLEAAERLSKAQDLSDGEAAEVEAAERRAWGRGFN